jgi:hypothetical protein
MQMIMSKNDTNKFKENKQIFKALFPKNHDIKKVEALVTIFYEQKQNKSIKISNYENRLNVRQIK